MKTATWSNDIATPRPGEYDVIMCGFCNSEMNVRRNVNGATGMAEAMAKRSHLHDSFECPSKDEDWHIQAKKLIQMAQETPSKRLEEMFLLEAQEILFKKTATKKDFRRF